eukprot:PITA_22507
MNVVEPSSYDEAKEYEEWRDAMNEEYNSIMKNDTWELTKFPKNKVPIGCKWLYKSKFNVDGSIDKHKAKLVAKGYSQKEGIDYEDTFVPVAKLNTIRIMIALATKYNWKMHQLDVKSAFLNGELKEEVYLVQLEGFVKQGHEHLVCRLKKALYGLKQAPKSWYVKIDSFFYEKGFMRSKNDPNLYIKEDEGKNVALISVYVDDLIITGNACKLIEEVKNQLSHVFEMKDLGELHSCLGLEVWRESGYFDSDWDVNLDDRKSTTGYVFNIGSRLISWSSEKQPTVSLSSTEAEYKALCSATCEAIWLRRILEDVGETQQTPTVIRCGNQSTIKLAKNPIYHARTKHIDTQHHFVREKLQSKEIDFSYCNTNENLADIFTKPLGKAKFEMCRSKLRVVENPNYVVSLAET